jgi:hypothetical protein
MGLAAGRAKQVAEELLGSGEKAKKEAKNKANTFVDEGRRAAAEVVSALRREATALLRDLENLEGGLRGESQTEHGTDRAAASADRPTAGEPVKPGAKNAGATKAGSTKAAGRTGTGKAASATKGAAAKASVTKASATKAGATKAGATKAGATKAGATKAGAAKTAARRSGGRA